jgi:dihydroorotase
MKLINIPALIDPHVHFRIPGAEHKEDWITASRGCWQGGITTVFDMPNNHPPCTTLEQLLAKKSMIEAQLRKANIPLRYYLYLGAAREHIDELEKAAPHIIGIKVFMGSSTGSLLIEDQPTLDRIFKIAAELGKVVAVHAEDETFLRSIRGKYAGTLDPAMHSKIRDPKAAEIAVERAINLSAKYGTKLYILHMSTMGELHLLRQAKASHVPVYGEATPNHLFLDERDYKYYGNHVVVNPPLRSYEDQEALWEAVRDGTIDTLGTDHAPHTLAEKQLPFGQAPSGIPGIETLLPLMMDAVSRGKLTLERFIALSRTNIEAIFGLESHDDYVVVDLDSEKEVRREDLLSKCGWSPYEGRVLKGWPVRTVSSQSDIPEKWLSDCDPEERKVLRSLADG